MPQVAGTCSSCRFWEPPAGGAGPNSTQSLSALPTPSLSGQGVCTLLSGQADTPPTEAQAHGGPFTCGPQWFCKNYQALAGGGNTPGQGSGPPTSSVPQPSTPGPGPNLGSLLGP